MPEKVTSLHFYLVGAVVAGIASIMWYEHRLTMDRISAVYRQERLKVVGGKDATKGA